MSEDGSLLGEEITKRVGGKAVSRRSESLPGRLLVTWELPFQCSFYVEDMGEDQIVAYCEILKRWCEDTAARIRETPAEGTCNAPDAT